MKKIKMRSFLFRHSFFSQSISHRTFTAARRFNMSSTSFVPKTPSNPEKYSFLLPGITPQTLLQSEHLLEKNHTEHDIFFNESGFHK